MKGLIGIPVTILLLVVPAASFAQWTPLQEGFEGGFPPSGWSEDTSGGEEPASWDKVSSGSSPSCSPHSGGGMAMFNSYSAGGGEEAYLRSGSVDLSGAETAKLRFWMYRDSGYSGSDDSIMVLVAAAGGDFDAIAEVPRYWGSSGWEEQAISVTPYLSNGARIEFLGHSGNGNNIFIDDVSIECNTLADGANGKACANDGDCASGDCDPAPGGATYCADPSAACVWLDKTGKSQGFVRCYGGDRYTCSGTDQWQSADCYNGCGYYSDVDGCEVDACVQCSEECSSAFGLNVGCDSEAYCTQFIMGECLPKKQNGEQCENDNECVSINCRKSPSGNRYCVQFGKKCASAEGAGLGAGESVCYLSDSFSCTGKDALSQQDCKNTCGNFKDVDGCSAGQCLACPSTCSANQDCDSGYTCSGGQCGQGPSPVPCNGPQDCGGGQCEDGYCCDTACRGMCRACNLQGSLGICAFIAGGQDPSHECPGQYCAGGAVHYASLCDGGGACVEGGVYQCPSGACNGAECAPVQPQDAGHPPDDAGQQQHDAGQPREDAGQTGDDGGRQPVDETHPDRDAGQQPADVDGTHDAGKDASTPAADGLPVSDGGNSKPVAEAGEHFSALIGTVVVLDGSGSFDPDGDPISFSWKFSRGPEVVFLNGEDTAFPSFMPSFAGEFRFSLRVSDGRLESAPDFVNVNVRKAGATAEDGCGCRSAGGDGGGGGAMLWGVLAALASLAVRGRRR